MRDEAARSFPVAEDDDEARVLTGDVVTSHATSDATSDAVTGRTGRTADDGDADDDITDIPEDLRFDVGDRDKAQEQDRIAFALGGQRVYARRPKEYTMLALASAMSGMADGPDVAYCVMLFCTDSFDGRTRAMVSQLKDGELYTLIQRLCDQWGEDTSAWRTRGGNRAARRARPRRR